MNRFYEFLCCSQCGSRQTEDKSSTHGSSEETLPFITEIITFNRIEMVYMYLKWYLVLQMLNTVS